MISDRIFELLKQQKMTQKELSIRTGIAESTICDWKRKGLNPSLDKLPSICRALSVSPEILLGMESSDPGHAVGYILDDDEKSLIDSYRNGDDGFKRRLLYYAMKVSEVTAGSDIDASATAGFDTAASGTTVDTADSVPVDSDFLIKKQLTRKLRRLARLDRIVLDESQHASGLNLHLFKYLDYIGLDKLDFIKDYLCHIQSFMIEEFRSQERFDNAVCVLDEFYRISLYIKADETSGSEIIVSFHENNKGGIAKRNSVLKKHEYVYVFADSISAHVKQTDMYSINLFITRGVKTFHLDVAAHRYDDEGFLVRYADINQALMGIMNDYLTDLYTADLDSAGIELFSSLQQLSFTSYGNDSFSNISLLIDSILIQKDPLSKSIADGALCIYCSSLSLNAADRQELLDTLRDRFSVNSVKVLPELLTRVEMNLIEE